MDYTFVRFKDLIEDEDIHYGCLVSDSDYGVGGKDLYVICFECGSVFEPEDYEIVEELDWSSCEAALNAGFGKLNKVTVPLKSGSKLIAEANCDPDYKEIFVYLEKDNSVWQDLAIVGEQYEYSDESESAVPLPGQYSIKVYADKDSEDWTDEFKVAEYKAE